MIGPFDFSELIEIGRTGAAFLFAILTAINPSA